MKRTIIMGLAVVAVLVCSNLSFAGGSLDVSPDSQTAISEMGHSSAPVLIARGGNGGGGGGGNCGGSGSGGGGNGGRGNGGGGNGPGDGSGNGGSGPKDGTGNGPAINHPDGVSS